MKDSGYQADFAGHGLAMSQESETLSLDGGSGSGGDASDSPTGARRIASFADAKGAEDIAQEFVRGGDANDAA